MEIKVLVVYSKDAMCKAQFQFLASPKICFNVEVGGAMAYGPGRPGHNMLRAALKP